MITKIVIQLLVVTFFFSLSSITHSANTEYAITVGSDRVVYIINLNTLEVIKKSETFPELGSPASIDYDDKIGRLYVGSGRGYRQTTYYPLTVFEIKKNTIKLIDKFKLDEGESISEIEDISEVYTVRLSPDRKKLYLMYGHKNYTGGSAVFDLTKMELQKGIVSFIGEDDIFSNDGKLIYVVAPGRTQKELRDAREVIKKFQWKVVTFDIKGNRKIGEEEEDALIKSGRGLNPPDKKLNFPLITTTDNGRKIEAYDRNNGTKIWGIDLDSKRFALRNYPALYSNNQKALIPMDTGEILIIDLINGKILSKIDVGVSTTNVIVTKDIDVKKKDE